MWKNPYASPDQSPLHDLSLGQLLVVQLPDRSSCQLLLAVQPGYIIQRYYRTKVLLTKVLFGQRYYRTKVLSGTKSDQYLKNLIYLRYFNKLKTS